ncbi:MAG: Na/Pi symporter, partial [Firmicutes bacterium]|nr:Na/Pi symporter [Bacillota bacterium]
LLAGSSSAITVMVVGFVSAGLLELSRALVVVLGAAIGTTLTVQLISFNVIRYAPILIFLGVGLTIALRHSARAGIAALVLGFGFIFYGMMVMISAVHALAALPWIRLDLNQLNHHPILAFLLPLVLTAFIQNSATVIALAMTFRVHSLISLPIGLEIVLAANVGSTAAAVYSALLNGSRSAKRTAFAYFLMKFVGAVIALLLLHPFARLVMDIGTNPARMLANAHSLFNVAIAVLFTPLAYPISRLMLWMIPEIQPKPVSQLLDESKAESIQRALFNAQQETARLAHMINQRIIMPLADYFADPTDDKEKEILHAEADIDVLHQAITHYLLQAPQRWKLQEPQRIAQIRQLYLTNHLEHLSDTAVKAMKSRRKLRRRNFSWPPQLWESFSPLLADIADQYQQLDDAIKEDQTTAALTVVQNEPELQRAEGQMRLAILTQPQEEQWEYASTLLELSDDLSLLIDRIATLGRALLGIL